jgi:hypothetical protein
MGGIFIVYLLIILFFFGLAYLPKMKAIKDVFLACRDLKKLHKVYLIFLKIAIFALTFLLSFYIFFKQIRTILLASLSGETMLFVREVLHVLLDTYSVKTALMLCLAYVANVSMVMIVIFGMITALSLTCAIRRMVKKPQSEHTVFECGKFYKVKNNCKAICGSKYIKVLGQLRL